VFEAEALRTPAANMSVRYLHPLDGENGRIASIGASSKRRVLMQQGDLTVEAA